MESLAITLFPLASGLARPLFGRISDSLGRPKSLIIAMLMEALGVLSFLEGPELKLLGPIILGVSGGALLTLILTLVTDFFGTRYSTSNTAKLYTGKALTGVVLASLQALETPQLAYFAFPLLGISLIKGAQRVERQVG